MQTLKLPLFKPYGLWGLVKKHGYRKSPMKIEGNQKLQLFTGGYVMLMLFSLSQSEIRTSIVNEWGTELGLEVRDKNEKPGFLTGAG